MVTYALITLKTLYELPYSQSNEGACCGRRSDETKTGVLPVWLLAKAIHQRRSGDNALATYIGS